MNAENLPIIEGIHRYICGNFNVYTDRCENKQFGIHTKNEEVENNIPKFRLPYLFGYKTVFPLS